MANRPFVFINVAMTVDGKIDTVERHGAAISSPRDRERVDQLRASCDAVMVGARTLLSEDPKLTVRSSQLQAERAARGLPENPVKVGVISRVDDPEKGASIRTGGNFLSFGPARVVVFTSQQTEDAQVGRLRDQGADVFIEGERRVDLAAALAQLGALGVKRLMVEGGGTLNAELLAAGLVDEIHLFVAPLLFGGAAAPTPADGPGLSREEGIELRLLDIESLGDSGLVLRYSVEHPRA